MKYTLSKQERAHFNAIEYTIKYLETSLQQFVAGVITERLGYEPRPDQEVKWKLSEDLSEIEVEVDDKPGLYSDTKSK